MVLVRILHSLGNSGRLDFVLLIFLSLIFLSVPFLAHQNGKGTDRKMWDREMCRHGAELHGTGEAGSGDRAAVVAVHEVVLDPEDFLEGSQRAGRHVGGQIQL